MYSDIDKIIDKLHFKSLSHFKDKVRETYPNITDKELKSIYDNRVKDPYVKKKQIRKYQIRIFSNSFHTFFHDLFVNGGNSSSDVPKYFHLFIGTNNRYACAIPIDNKNAETIKNSLQRFLNNHKCIKLTSDEELAFLSKLVLDFLKENEIRIQTIPDKNHSALGIIDRFIRTLRDMNTPRESSKSQSNTEKYKTFTAERMSKLINIYNNTFHTSIKMSPQQMYNNPELEQEYIFQKMKERDEQRKINDFELKDGDLVRLILPKHDGIGKKRYRYSKEYYKVDSKNGNMYNIVARDGTSLVRPRFLLRKLTPNEEQKMKFIDTIPGKNAGVIDRIIEQLPRGRVKVAFMMPDGSEYIDTIPETFMRDRFNLSGL